MDCCPTRVFSYDDNTGAVFIERGDEAKCMFCKECTFTAEDFRQTPEDALAVSVAHSSNRFTFTVETTGALSAKDVVSDALDVLMVKLSKIIELNQQIALKS